MSQHLETWQLVRARLLVQALEGLAAATSTWTPEEVHRLRRLWLAAESLPDWSPLAGGSLEGAPQAYLEATLESLYQYLEAAPAPSPRVLIVDEDRTFAFRLQKCLEAGGVSVQLAEDLPRARDVLSSGGIDAVLLASRVGGQDGRELLFEIPAQGGPPVFLLTREREAHVPLEAFCLGVSGVFAKPASATFLAQVLEAALARPGTSSRVEVLELPGEDPLPEESKEPKEPKEPRAEPIPPAPPEPRTESSPRLVEDESGPPRRALVPEGKTPRVLMLSADRLLVSRLARGLRRTGYELLRHHRIPSERMPEAHVLLLDLNLDPEDPVGFFATLRDDPRFRDLPCFLILDPSERTILEEVQDLPEIDILFRPVTSSEVLFRLRRWFGPPARLSPASDHSMG